MKFILFSGSILILKVVSIANIRFKCAKESHFLTLLKFDFLTWLNLILKTTVNILDNFVSKLMEVGCKKFIIHARTAILNGLSTKDNLTVPKLNYDRVFQLKKKFKSAEIIINGGINNLDNKEYYFNKTDGIMIGRAAI